MHVFVYVHTCLRERQRQRRKNDLPLDEEDEENEEKWKGGGEEAEEGEQNIGFIPMMKSFIYSNAWKTTLLVKDKNCLDIQNATSSFIWSYFYESWWLCLHLSFKPTQFNLRNLKISLFNHWLETRIFNFVNASE